MRSTMCLSALTLGHSDTNGSILITVKSVPSSSRGQASLHPIPPETPTYTPVSGNLVCPTRLHVQTGSILLFRLNKAVSNPLSVNMRVVSQPFSESSPIVDFCIRPGTWSLILSTSLVSLGSRAFLKTDSHSSGKYSPLTAWILPRTRVGVEVLPTVDSKPTEPLAPARVV
jgi:hypothetical protein